MTGADEGAVELDRRPKRADARRNYEALLEAAREAFSEEGTDASLEEIARRARVGIGTLYRHFPRRQDLFASVYVAEVERLCRAAQDLAGLPGWEALVVWFHSFVRYAATKRAVAQELVNSLGSDSALFRGCRAEIYAAGAPLLERAQREGVVRADVSFDDVLRLISGITMVAFPETGQLDRVMGIALDGLRVRTRSQADGAQHPEVKSAVEIMAMSR